MTNSCPNGGSAERHVLRPRGPAIGRLERRGVRLDEARRAIDAEVLEQRAEPDAEARIGLPKQRRAAAIALEIVEVVIDPRSGGADRIDIAALLAIRSRSTERQGVGDRNVEDRKRTRLNSSH